MAELSDISNDTYRNTLYFYSAPTSLGGLQEVKDFLSSRGILPAESDRERRIHAVDVLKRVLKCDEFNQPETGGRPNLVLAPVGSFGLGVWIPSSDVNCLCVGDISPKTFFALATSRLRRASSDGITALRRVKASSGTVLRLNIDGIKIELQYCSAVHIAER